MREVSHRGHFVRHNAPATGYTLLLLGQEKRRPQLCSRVRRLRSPHRNDVQAEPAGVSIHCYTLAPRVVILVTFLKVCLLAQCPLTGRHISYRELLGISSRPVLWVLWCGVLSSGDLRPEGEGFEPSWATPHSPPSSQAASERGPEYIRYGYDVLQPYSMVVALG
jgi:hypothetical protein